MIKIFRWAVLLAVLALSLPVLAQSRSEMFGDPSGTAITADNAADVVPLARYGRGTANSLAWSPDGTRLAVGGTAGVWLHRVTDFEEDLSPLVGHTAPVFCVAFNSDGSRLVSGGRDSSLRIWDPDTGELLQTLEVPYSAEFSTVDYSPDDSLIVTASLNTLLIWNAESGELVNQITADPSEAIAQIEFAPEGTRLVVRLANSVLKWFDLSTGAEIVSLPFQDALVSDFAWLPDASGIIRGTIGAGWQRYETSADSLMTFVTSGGETQGIMAMAISPDGAALATGSDTGVQFWDPATAESLGTLDAGEAISDLAYSSDGSILAALTEAGSLVLWDAESQEISVELRNVYHNSGAQTALFSPDGTQIAAAYLDNTGALVAAESGEFTTTLAAVDAIYRLPALAYSPDGTALAVSDGFGISLKDRESGEEIAYFRTIFAPVFAWSPDGTVIAAGDSTGTLYLWDTGGELLMSRTDHTLGINSIVFSDDGSLILTASDDGTMRTYGIAE